MQTFRSWLWFHRWWGIKQREDSRCFIRRPSLTTALPPVSARLFCYLRDVEDWVNGFLLLWFQVYSFVHLLFIQIEAVFDQPLSEELYLGAVHSSDAFMLCVLSVALIWLGCVSAFCY